MEYLKTAVIVIPVAMAICLPLNKEDKFLLLPSKLLIATDVLCIAVTAFVSPWIFSAQLFLWHKVNGG